MRLVPLAAVLVSLAGCASASRSTADDAALFAKFKALEGDWVMKGSEEAPQGAKVSYRVTSGGSAVMETVFAGDPHEMVTFYTLDRGRLVLTHYCAIGNQPHMAAGQGPGADEVRFELSSLGNGDPSRDMHMHRAHFTFLDANRIESRWTLWKDGKDGETVTLSLARAAN